MIKAIRFALLGASLFGLSEAVIGVPNLAQMGNTSTSIGSVEFQSHENSQSIPKVSAKAMEGIQRHSIVTGGGFVHQSNLLLPQTPALDKQNKLHDAVKHPYETLPSLQNLRLKLIQ